MTTYKELLEKRSRLEQEIQEARQKEAGEALLIIREFIRDYDLTQEEIFPPANAGGKPAKATAKVAAKYKNPETGETWTGRGKAPRWIDGKDRDQFLIASE